MTSATQIQAWFDGSCEPNPGGHAAWGAVVKVDGVIVFAKGGYIGFGEMMTNNVAEYCGCIAALEEISKYAGNAVVFGDSEMVIRQMSGKYRAKRGLYMPRFYEAKALPEKLGKQRVTFEWISREQNQRSDALSKQVLLERCVRANERGKIQEPAVHSEVPRTKQLTPQVSVEPRLRMVGPSPQDILNFPERHRGM
jgi:ribonuclease HI